jgi:hypothetical protein
MVRIIDSRGRLFGKVNIVDLVVLLVILAVVVFAVVRVTTNSVETVPVRMTLLVRSLDNRLLEPFKVGLEVRDRMAQSLGTVTAVDIQRSRVELVTPTGELKTFDSELRSDVSLVVAATGTVDESAVHVGGTAVRVGASLSITGPGYETVAVVTEVVWGADATQ